MHYQGTNWVHPLYELPFTGGFPDAFGASPDAFQEGEIGQLLSLIPGPGPAGPKNSPVAVGDNPNLPRDPDKFDSDVGFERQREFRERSIPSGLANEVFLDVYAQPASFMPGNGNLESRLNQAYKLEVARVSPNGHGIITATVGDIDTPTDGFSDNTRLYLTPPMFNRFAVSREINDGSLVPVSPSVPASTGRDADDR